MHRIKHQVGKLAFIGILVFWAATGCDRQTKAVDNTNRAQTLLEKERSKVLKHLEQEVNAEWMNRAVELGLWEEAERYLQTVSKPDGGLKLAKARLLIKKHRYRGAGKYVQEVLSKTPKNRQARLLQARLAIQAWNLQKATGIAKKLLDENGQDARPGHILGEIALLNRRQEEAMEWAQ